MVLLDPWLFPCDTECFGTTTRTHTLDMTYPLDTTPSQFIFGDSLRPLIKQHPFFLTLFLVRSSCSFWPLIITCFDNNSDEERRVVGEKGEDTQIAGADAGRAATAGRPGAGRACDGASGSGASASASTRCAKLTRRSSSSTSTTLSSSTSSSSPPSSCCPFLVIHGDWQWPENSTKENAFVHSVERGQALHLRIFDSGHHSYSDIGMLAPPIFAGELAMIQTQMIYCIMI